MSDYEAAEVLRYARDVVLAEERNWIQGTRSYQDAYCAIGAIVEAKAQLPSYAVGTGASLVAVLGPGIAAWNDTPGRSYSEVLDAFDRAIKLAEED